MIEVIEVIGQFQRVSAIGGCDIRLFCVSICDTEVGRLRSFAGCREAYLG
jgi:hypothetical protein